MTNFIKKGLYATRIFLTKVICVMDFRNVNYHTVQDNYPLPNIEEILCLLGQAKYMSAFDMLNKFHAVKIAEEDI